MAKFADRLKSLRNEKQLSQQDLATQLGCVSKSSINMYERGERDPGLDTLEAIADYFNVDLDYLLGKSDYPSRYSSIIGNIHPDFADGVSRPASNDEIALFFSKKPITSRSAGAEPISFGVKRIETADSFLVTANIKCDGKNEQNTIAELLQLIIDLQAQGRLDVLRSMSDVALKAPSLNKEGLVKIYDYVNLLDASKLYRYKADTREDAQK